jgi:hypothetical protein
MLRPSIAIIARDMRLLIFTIHKSEVAGYPGSHEVIPFLRITSSVNVGFHVHFST